MLLRDIVFKLMYTCNTGVQSIIRQNSKLLAPPGELGQKSPGGMTQIYPLRSEVATRILTRVSNGMTPIDDVLMRTIRDRRKRRAAIYNLTRLHPAVVRHRASRMSSWLVRPTS